MHVDHNVTENANIYISKVGSWASSRTKNERGEEDFRQDNTQERLPKLIGLTLARSVYATMQPVPGPPCPSASMGVEGMGSDSEELDVMVKSVEKESIVVVNVWVERCYESVRRICSLRFSF